MAMDTELKSTIETELLNDDRLSAAAIDVSVDNQIVTLQGTVQSFRRKLLAHEIVASYAGVRDVINRLTVEPPGPIPDNEILDLVRSTLEANAEITKSTILVTVQGGRVTLTGNVGSYWERAVAEDAARSVRGVRDVVNLLKVSLATKISAKELGASLQAAIGRTRGLQDADIAVAVGDSGAVLSGNVDEFWKKQAAEAVARRFGLLHVRNEIAVVGRA